MCLLDRSVWRHGSPCRRKSAACNGLRLTARPDLAVQQRRCMVPAPRLQIKDAQGEERDVLQGLLSLQDAEVALPPDPSGAPCRLSR